MKHKHHAMLCKSVSAMLLIFAPACMPASTSASPPEAKIVSRLLGENFQAGFRKVTETQHRSAVHLSGPTGSASLDIETGILLAFSRSENGHNETGDIKVTAEEAHTKAVAFLGKTGLHSDDAWVLTQNRYISHGAGGREYKLKWSKFFHGVRLPSMIDVSVNADTGEIESYFVIDDPVTIPLNARLSAEDAVQVVARKAGWEHPNIEQVYPTVWYEPYYPGPQALLWEIHLTNPQAHGGDNDDIQARVDAMTGTIVNYVIPMSKHPAGSNPKSVLPAGSAERLPALPTLDLQAALKGKVPATIFQRAKRNQ